MCQSARQKVPAAARIFAGGAGLFGLPQLAAAQTAVAPVATTAAADAEPLLTLTATEHAFLVAAVDTLIPADDLEIRGSSNAPSILIDGVAIAGL